MHIRLMTHDDLSLGLRLSAQAGWNQTEADWRRFLWLAPEGCFVGQWAGEPVATAAAFAFGSIGWIAMVLVDEAFRHRGIATRLVERALQYLDAQGVQTARLDATPLGRPVYERLGFLAEYQLLRMQGTVSSPSVDSSSVALPAERVGAVCELDAEITGTQRGRLIQRLYAERPESATAAFEGEAAVGYAFLRPGRRAAQVGPASAISATTGVAMLERVLACCPAGPVFADVPADNRAAVAWFEARRFVVQREFTRMVRGRRVTDCPQRIWASSGPEKG
jgi:GNAT superfamily N-acetyltransferase